MKKYLLALISLLLIVSCASLIPAQGPEVISIQVLDEYNNPIKTYAVTQTSGDIIYEVTNALNGTVAIPVDFKDQYIYIGGPGYEGIIIQATDTVVVLKSIKYRQ